MASPTDYVNLLQVIKKLDRRSKQVHVQVLIAEISLDKSRALGVQAGAVAAGVVGKYLQGGGLFDPFNTFGSLLDSSTASGSAISTLITDKLKDASRPVTGMAIVQALESEGLLNVLSTPNILTSDNKEAEIFVGENVPFQGSTTQSQITTTSVERKDIGINLKLKPQISEGDYIRLEINQEISNVKGTIDVGPAGAKDLTTTKRSAKTSIVVRDKDTIVIGGLIQDQENESVNKMPLLGDIPGLGWLFKTTTKTRKKTNLIILLTPQIVKDGADLSKVS
jgi:general secretion pathway protein D